MGSSAREQRVERPEHLSTASLHSAYLSAVGDFVFAALPTASPGMYPAAYDLVRARRWPSGVSSKDRRPRSFVPPVHHDGIGVSALMEWEVREEPRGRQPGLGGALTAL